MRVTLGGVITVVSHINQYTIILMTRRVVSDIIQIRQVQLTLWRILTNKQKEVCKMATPNDSTQPLQPIPRSRSYLLNVMFGIKADFDALHFHKGGGQPLTNAYKVTQLVAWRELNTALLPLLEELKTRETWEREQRVTRMLTVASRPLWFEREKLRVGR